MTDTHHRMLVLKGDRETLEQIMELAIEYGLGYFWVREKSKAKPAATQRRRRCAGTKPTHETRFGKLLLEAMRAHPMREWHSEQLAEIMEKHDYLPNSISPSLTYLAREGYIVRTAPGYARLTALGRGDIATGVPQRSGRI